MITVYRLESSGAYRTLWLLEELQLSYSLASTTPAIDNALSETQIVIRDNAQLISGSLAVANHLLNIYDRFGLRPPIASVDYVQFNHWLNYIETDVYPLVQRYLLSEKLANARVPFFARSLLKKTINQSFGQSTLEQLNRCLEKIEQHLAQHSWICGSYFSIADIQLSAVFEQIPSLINEAQYPNTCSYINAFKERTAYKAAQEKLAIGVQEAAQQAESTENDLQDTEASATQV